MQIQFIDQPAARRRLYPLTYTRPVADLRVGILTLSEKWVNHLNAQSFGYLTADYLKGKYPAIEPAKDIYWIIDGILPTETLLQTIRKMKPGMALYQEGVLLAALGTQNPLDSGDYEKKEYTGESQSILHTWDIFSLNGQEIRRDYEILTTNKVSGKITDPHTVTYGNDIFLEEGVQIKAAVLNAENGPIYLGKNAEVQEGAVIRGPFALGESSVVNMGAKIRGDSSTGPYCKIGGEISNCVFWGYSNKGHDGFLGNAVIGQWCNLGAGTNNSNLKNNYDPVKIWDYETETFIPTGLQFLGLIMGDHSKCSINTMFNTGTIVGVACNIYGEGFPRNIVHSFSWGGATGFVTHHPRKALITAKAMMKRRNMEPTEDDKVILNHIFEATGYFRAWENK